MDNTTPFQPWAADDNVKNVKTDKEIEDAKHCQENVNQPKHTQIASYIKETVANPSDSPGPSKPSGSAEHYFRGKDVKMDSSKIASMQQIVENTVSPEGRQRVAQLLEAVEALSGAERLLLYLRLPTGVPPHDPLKQPINPLGSRAELQQTVTWIQTHLEVDPDVSLPKQDVYDEYIAHCMSSNMKPLSTADFGKVMKQVYPTVRPRRLGTRGNSRYCYAGLRKKVKLEVPQLPDLGDSSKELRSPSRESERIICDWAESKLGFKVNSISELARHVVAAAPGPSSLSPSDQHGSAEDATSRQLMKHLKRKIQGQGTPGRPKKNKGVEEGSPPAAAPPPEPWATGTAASGGTGVSVASGVTGVTPVTGVAGVTPVAGVAGLLPPPRAHYREEWPYQELVPLPINLSSDVSLDLRRRPPLPGKKMILEAYQSEQALSPPRAPQPPPPPPHHHYLPKKMRAAESLGGKLTQRTDPAMNPQPAMPSHNNQAQPIFLEDPKNLASRSTSRAAALAREQEAASSAGAGGGVGGAAGAGGALAAAGIPRERVISISGIDKHDLDDYLHEGSSQEHEEELLQYFQRREGADPPDTGPAPAPAPAPAPTADAFLDTGADPSDDQLRNNEKISQLRELLEKNLKQSGSEEAAVERFEFVPISGAAGFVSPRATPRAVPARRRRPPALPARCVQPMSAPPSPHLLPAAPRYPPPRHAPPLSADPLSNEVSQFFQDPLVYTPYDTFRSQSVPLKRGMNVLSYNNTPVGSVPPTPVPNEFCDFGSLADTCDISKAGLNPETLDKIYDAIDSSNDVLSSDAAQMLTNGCDSLTNGCDSLTNGCDSLTNGCDSLTNGCDSLTNGCDNLANGLVLTNGCDGLPNGLSNGCGALTNGCSSLLMDEITNQLGTYGRARSAPGTPGEPRRRVVPKSVPPTPHLITDDVFTYNRDFLINGNSVEFEPPLQSPLHDIMTADLLADLDKMDPPHYPDL